MYITHIHQRKAHTRAVMLRHGQGRKSTSGESTSVRKAIFLRRLLQKEVFIPTYDQGNEFRREPGIVVLFV